MESHTGLAIRRIPARIFFGTWDGFLIAIDCKTGWPVESFGHHGEIDLKAGMKDEKKYPRSHYGLSAAPMVYKNVVITGSHTQDAPSFGPPGDARGWDARTGKLLWTFHSVPRPGEPGHETWLNDGWKERSGVNAWTTGSVDTKTGTVFMTFDSPSTDLYGGGNWGGGSVDPKLGYFFFKVKNDGAIGRMDKPVARPGAIDGLGQAVDPNMYVHTCNLG